MDMPTAGDRMQRIAMLLTLLALCLPLAAGESPRQLHVYTWADYFDSGVINDFQKQYDCDVVLDYFDSNELLLKAMEMAPDGYDVLTPSSYMCAILHRRGLLRDLDLSLLPNARHLDDDAITTADDPEFRYSIPYTRTVTGIGYNAKEVHAGALGSWDIFDKTAYSGRMALLTDMRECLGAALKMLGHSLNSTDPDELAAAGEVVRDWKRVVALFDVEEGKAGLIDGRFVIAQNYNGDMMQAMADNPDLGFFVPKEGSSVTIDDFVISSGTAIPDLAHAFINHMLDPEMARRNMESVFYYMPNAAALERLDPWLRDHPAFAVPEEVLERCEVIREVGQFNARYEKVWNRIVDNPRAH